MVKISLYRNSLTILKLPEVLKYSYEFFRMVWYMFVLCVLYVQQRLLHVGGSCLARSCKRSKATHFTWYFFLLLLWKRKVFGGIAVMVGGVQSYGLPQETIYRIERSEERELVMSGHLACAVTYQPTYVSTFGYQKCFFFFIFKLFMWVPPKWRAFQMKWAQ